MCACIVTVTKVLDWSSTGFLTAAIQSSIYLWSARTQRIQYKINANVNELDDFSSCTVRYLKWDRKGVKLAYSFTVSQDLSGRNNHTIVTDTSIHMNESEDSNDSTFLIDNHNMNTSIEEDQFENNSTMETDSINNIIDQSLLEEELIIYPSESEDISVSSQSDALRSLSYIKVCI